jgi:general secretion pathway protein J
MAAETDRRSGFTFIEVLAALALTAAFVAVVLPFAGRLVERWWSGEQSVETADAWMQATARLSADLAEAIPLSVAPDRPPRLMFRMARRSVVLVRPTLAAGAANPFEIAAYVIEPSPQGDALVLYAAPFDPDLIDADPSAFGTATAILAGPFRLAFAAVGADLGRSDEWSNPRELPLRLEVLVTPIGKTPVPAAAIVLPIAARMSLAGASAPAGAPATARQ